MEGWLFQSPHGTQIDPSKLRKLFNRLLTDATLRRVRFHDLRHSFASLLLQNGESLTYVKEQMGHSSINVTVDIYGHLVPGGNRQAVDGLDDAGLTLARGRLERTVKTSVKKIRLMAGKLIENMARPEGFEPPTLRSEEWRKTERQGFNKKSIPKIIGPPWFHFI